MKTEEESALQKCHLSLLKDLDVKEILPYLFQNEMITPAEYDEFEELDGTRTAKCKKFLRLITRPESKCTFIGFIKSLRYNNTYSFLADIVEQTHEELLRQRDIETADKEIRNTFVVPPEQSSSKRSDIIYEPVRKINVFTKRRKAISALAHKLKRLSHEGDIETFQKVVKAIDIKFKRNKLNRTKSVNDRMEFADMRFAAIEAEISSKRVRYDQSLSESDMFRHMESVIPFTSNPRVSSMSYLARYGSAVAMTDSIDDGLAYVQFAKEHTEHVTPCKDTGMVYYIEVNLLSQKYETDPTNHLKANILKTSEQGIAQFTDENDEIRKDYQRMLLLKRVFCYLGVGLFCKKIEKAETTHEDIEAAKKVIDFIETSDIWQGMEKRRKMLFYVAKSEYYKQQGNEDLAMVHAKEAQKLGKENNWTAELPNISEMVIELERKRTLTCKLTNASEVDIIAELFEDFSDLEDELGENNTEITHSLTNYIDHVHGSNNLNDLQSAFIHSVQETGVTSTHMMGLKEYMINDQPKETVRWTTANYDHSLYTDIACTRAKEDTPTQIMDLKEVMLHNSAGEAVYGMSTDYNQNITSLKEDSMEQHKQNLQFQTEQHSRCVDFNSINSDKQQMENDRVKLDNMESVQCMSYLKEPEEEYQMSLLKDQFQLQHKHEPYQQNDTCTHSDLSNDAHLMLLKEHSSNNEQSLISESEYSSINSPYNISHNMTLLKDGDEDALPVQNCDMPITCSNLGTSPEL